MIKAKSAYNTALDINSSKGMASEEKLIRLLIVDEGFHKAEQITSSLRATGMHVRAEFAEDAEDMSELLDSKSFDLVLFSIDLMEFSIDQAQELIRNCGKHIALVATTSGSGQEKIVEVITQGAQDLVCHGNLDHLIQVIKREAYNINLWRRAMRLELSHLESEKRCQALLANSKDAVAYVHEGMFIYSNTAFMDLFGIPDFDELEGTPIIDMVIAEEQAELKSLLRELGKEQQDDAAIDLTLLHSGGEKIEATVEFSRASYDSEPCSQILIRNKADTTELEQQISYLHQHDMVTNLYNRQYYMEQLKTATTQAVNGVDQYAMVYISIDNFNAIRDKIGISGCDSLISDLAGEISKAADDKTLVARFSAYTYTCLVTLGTRDAVEAFANQLLETVDQHIVEIGNQSINATCSISIVFIDENTPDNPNEIVSRAERTCDDLQVNGGNKIGIFVPKAGEMTQDEADGIIAEKLKDALSNNRIDGLYQPIIGIKGQGGQRYQSSLLIKDAENNVMEYEQYHVAAERTGVARMLDRWKILHAIKRITEARTQGNIVDIFIPLSVDSIIDASLPAWISDNLSKSKVSGEQLVLMVIEEEAVTHLKATKALFKAAKELHCQFVIDEFGDGTNPFQLYKHINADFLRINSHYTNQLSQNQQHQDSIKAIAEQASSMEVNTIVPAVDDASSMSVVWSLGVDYIQGNFLQPPEEELGYDFSSM